MKKLIYILFSIFSLSSCIRALDDTGSMPVAGMWASADENGFVSKYIEFKKGNYRIFESERQGYYSEGKVWAVAQSEFKKVKQEEYSIIDGTLYVRNTGYPISMEEDVLVIDGVKYYTLSDFTAAYYSTITCTDPKNFTYEYNATEIILEYSVDNCPFGNKVEVATDAAWLGQVDITDEAISFEIEENTSGELREAEVILTYPTAKPLVLTLKQTYAEPKILLDLSSISCDYQGGEYEFHYDVQFPREGQRVEVACNEDWITDLVAADGTVAFGVAENNSGSDRTCEILITYGNVSESFKVSQTYSEPSILLNAGLITVDYHATPDCFFTGEVRNPRKDCTVQVSCTEEWITDLEYKPYSDASFKIEFSVLENNDNEPERHAYIAVRYGELTKMVEVVQTGGLPVIKMVDTGVRCSYEEASYGFTYSIENPRESFNVEVATEASWISGLSVSENFVSFEVAENNSGADRIGEIIISYGSVSAKFIVDQEYVKPYLYLEADQSMFGYKGGSSAIVYVIKNPRKDAEVKVSCTAGWIKGLSVKDSGTNGKIYFEVTENNESEQERIARIDVAYGTETQSVSIIQTSDQPVIKMVDTGKRCSYTEASYSFTYSIENPRDSYVLKATTKESWITGLNVADGTVSFSVSENNGGSDRVGEIILTYGTATAKFVVDQEYVKPSVFLDADQTSFDYKGGSSAINYVIKNPHKDKKISVSCSAEWIKGLSCTDNDTEGKIYFQVAENNDSEPERTAYIDVAYGTSVQSISITQTSDSPVIKMTDGGKACGYQEGFYSFKYSIENPRESLAASVRTNADWITGLVDNNGEVSFKVAENNSGSGRVSEIIITYGSATAKFIVDQEYVKPVVHVDPVNMDFDYKGGSGVIHYAIQNPRKSMKVNVASSADWVKVVSYDGASTNGDITIEVEENNGSFSERTAYLDVSYGTSYQYVSIIQTNETYAIKLEDGGKACGYQEGSYSFRYTIENPRESLTASVKTNADWITGLVDNNGEVSFKVAENNSGSGRVSEIIITYGSATAKFIVDQEYVKPIVYVDPFNMDFNYKGGSGVIHYTVRYPRKNMKVNVSSSTDWAKVVSYDGASTDGDISIAVLENTSSDPDRRVAYIDISYGTSSQTVSVRQTNEAPVIKLEDGGKACGYAGGTYTFTYSIENPRENLAVRATTGVHWITGLSAENGVVSFNVAENNDGSSRAGQIVLTYGSATAKFIIDQEYVRPVVYVDPLSLDFNYKGGSAMIHYVVPYPRKNMKVNVSSSADWAKVVSYDGSLTEGDISIEVSENTSSDPDRAAYIDINYGTSFQTVLVRQTNEAPVIKLVDGGKFCSYAEGTYTFAYSIENPRESLTARATSGVHWITGLSAENGVVSFNVAENNDGSSRMGQIVLTYGSASVNFIVEQEYVKSALYLGTNSSDFGRSGGSSSFDYVVFNPRKNDKLIVSCDRDWVTFNYTESKEEVLSGVVSFRVAANNTSGPRSAYIGVYYGGQEEYYQIYQE